MNFAWPFPKERPHIDDLATPQHQEKCSGETPIMRHPHSTGERKYSIWPARDFSLSSEHEGFEHIVPLLYKLRLHWLLKHFPPRVVHGVYVLVNGFLTIAILALLAFVTRNPFVFPSVGPTAYLLFFYPW